MTWTNRTPDYFGNLVHHPHAPEDVVAECDSRFGLVNSQEVPPSRYGEGTCDERTQTTDDPSSGSLLHTHVFTAYLQVTT